MAGRAFCLPEGRFVETGILADRDVVLRYKQARRGTFTCEVNGSPMYVQERGKVVVLCHYPGGRHGGCELRFGMTDEHKRQQEYWAEAGQRAGYPTDLEVPTGNGTRLDVLIDGPCRTGIEVQHSGITTRAVKARTTKSFRAGFTSLWSFDSTAWPGWAPAVPTLKAASNWKDGKPTPGTATAVGPRRVVFERCEWGRLGAGCERRPCGKRHRIDFELIRGLTIDDVAAQVPAGLLVPIEIERSINGHPRTVVYLTSPEDLARYTDATRRDAAWTPGGPWERRSSKVTRGVDPVCRSARHDANPSSEQPAMATVNTRGLPCHCGRPGRSGYSYCHLHEKWST